MYMDVVMAGFLVQTLSGISSFLGSTVVSLCPQCGLVLLGFKIVILLFLIGWVRNHLGGGMVPTVVMLIVGYLVLFQYWFIFGPMSIIYLAIMFGIFNVFITFVFTKEALVPGLLHSQEEMMARQQMIRAPPPPP